jgi:hypothetical protein
VSILVAELEPLLPERDPPPARIDWEAVVGRLGTALPADYRDLCERWGRVRVDRWLTVEAPADDDESGLVGLVRWSSARGRDLRDDGHWDGALWPEPGGLLPWGFTEEGTSLFWRTDGEPDAWTVVTRRDDEDAGDWTATTHTGQGTVAFLARELAQTHRPLPLRLEPLDDDRPRWIPLGLPDEVDLGAIDDDGGGRRVCLDLGDVLGEPRRAALDGFLDHLAQREPRLHGAIEARREAVAYARERLGDRGS